MLIAIFGDVHGALESVYELCSRWERCNGGKIKLVLQTGDMGVFGRESKRDRATIRHAVKDPIELGCADYIEGGKKASHPTVFVAGNHEDFDLLEKCDGNIDPAGYIHYLKSGEVYTHVGCGESVCIAGIGGIAPKLDGKTRGDARKYISMDVVRSLDESMGKPKVDILIAHESPLGRGLKKKSSTGSIAIDTIMAALSPKYSFFGHYHDPPEPFLLGETWCIGLNRPSDIRSFARVERRDSLMGMLSTDSWKFHFVTNEELPAQQ